MDLNLNNLRTPNTRRSKLGLKRCNRSADSSRSFLRLKQTQTELTTTPKANGNNFSFGVDGSKSEEITPRNLGLKRLVESTNCRPYRLTLNRNIRESLTKKRLQFHLANETVNEDNEECITEEPKSLVLRSGNSHNVESLSRTDLIERIVHCRNLLREKQHHLDKVNDLKQAIGIWKQGFATALDDLQNKLESHIEKTDLLKQLGIEETLLKYAND